MSSQPNAPNTPTWPSEPPDLVVLLVEDDEADAYLIGCALAAQPRVSRVVRAVDGVAASEMVARGEVTPDLAFIDLQMPRKNGLSLLIEFADRPARRFPMVVLTSSSAEIDAARSRLRGAIRVIIKPDTAEAMSRALGDAINAVCPHRAARVPA